MDRTTFIIPQNICLPAYLVKVVAIYSKLLNSVYSTWLVSFVAWEKQLTFLISVFGSSNNAVT